jgi:hypothetical protein
MSLAATVTDGATKDVLEMIARDEARHAQNAWSVIRWCLEQDPSSVRSALTSVALRVQAVDPPTDEPGSDGSLEGVGIPGRQMQRDIARECLQRAQAQLHRIK